MARLFQIFLGALFLFTSSASAESSVAGRMQEMEPFLQGIAGCNLFSGVVLFEHEGKEILHKAFGYRNIEEQLPMNLGVKFSIDSMTKSFIAVALLKLQQERKSGFSIDDPLSKFLPGVTGPRGEIKVRYLMRHRSGLKQVEWDESLTDEAAEAWDEAPPEEFFTAYVKGAVVDGQPGEKFSYNNITYALLGYIVQLISGMPLETYIQEMLHEAGIRDATWTWLAGSFPEPSALKGYYFEGRDHFRLVPSAGSSDDYYQFWHQKGAGGLAMSAASLSRWTHVLREGVLLSRDSRDLLFQPNSPGDSDALGLFVERNQEGKIVGLNHGGGKRGSNGEFDFDLEKQTSIVILQNRSGFKERPNFRSPGAIIGSVIKYIKEGKVGELPLNAAVYCGRD